MAGQNRLFKSSKTIAGAGVTINCNGPHRTHAEPHGSCTGADVTAYFAVDFLCPGDSIYSYIKR